MLVSTASHTQIHLPACMDTTYTRSFSISLCSHPSLIPDSPNFLTTHNSIHHSSYPHPHAYYHAHFSLTYLFHSSFNGISSGKFDCIGSYKWSLDRACLEGPQICNFLKGRLIMISGMSKMEDLLQGGSGGDKIFQLRVHAEATHG